jgi:GTP-binding protein EngB required for normal cell division
MNKRYVIFTGRPNAGKSTTIKALTGMRVPTGKRPGTTRDINEYQISSGLFLIDMPGYGRIVGGARKNEDKIKDAIIRFIEDKKDNIVVAVHVINILTFIETEERLSRKGYFSVDIEMMVDYLLKKTGKFPLVAANKIDKGTEQQAASNLRAFITRINERTLFDVSDYIYPISAKTGLGVGPLKESLVKRLVSSGFKNPFEYLR